MFDKVNNLIKSRDFLIPKLLLSNYKKLSIEENELIIVIYLINQNDNLYNPKEISEILDWELVDVLTIMNNLTDKGIINISIETKGNKKTEIVDLSPLYEKLTFSIINKEEQNDTTIYTIIEKEFARPLTPLEYDLINSWIDSSYSEEIIIEALKEAVYNNVLGLKYMDKILYEWHRKGIKTKEDVMANKKKFKERKQVKKETFDYDWLSDEE